MKRCPCCEESRWVYPRPHLFGKLAKRLIAWSPYVCVACGWRGWRPSRTAALEHKANRRRAESVGTSTARTEPARRQRATSVSASFHRSLAGGARFLAMWRPLPSATKWLILSVVVLLMVALLFSRENQQADSSITSAVDSQPAAQLIARSTPPDRLPSEIHSRAPLPAANTAVERAQNEPPASAVSLRASAPPRRASPRASVTVRPDSKRESVAARSKASNLPQFRGSLVVDSEPRGALVAIDGKVFGPTPIVLQDLRAGSRVVRVVSTGYDPWSAAARVVANQKTHITATLQRRTKP
jgi:PEGA domain